MAQEEDNAASFVLNALSTNVPPLVSTTKSTRKRKYDDITRTQEPTQQPSEEDAGLDLEKTRQSNGEDQFKEDSMKEENEFITAEMLAVENKLKKQLEKDQIRREKINESLTNAVTEEELTSSRYNRLMHLLGRSTFYSTFMKDKLNVLKNKTPTISQKKPRKGRPAKPGAEPAAPAEGKRKQLKYTDEYDVAKMINEMDMKIVTSDEDEDFDDDELPPPTPGRRANARHGQPSVSQDAETYVNAMGFTVPALQPPLFEGGAMRDYQVDGLEWLKILDGNSVSGILGDEMGLGKTIQVISLLCHLIGQNMAGPYLIIAPLSTIPNWMSEFQRFAPQIPVLLLHGNESARKRLIGQFSAWHTVAGTRVHPVVVTSFQIPLAETAFFRSKKWRYLIVDEGHRLKNHRSLLAMELKRYNTVNRLILTGTPLQNNLAELWALLNFLLPEIFNDLSSFESWFDCKELLAKGGEDKILAQEQEHKILSTMHQILSPFLLRRMKSDVELNLPPKKELLVFCPLSATQKQLYSAVLDKSIADLFLKKEELARDTYDHRPKRRCVVRRNGRSYADASLVTDPDADDEDDDVENWPEVDRDVLDVVDKEDPTYKLRIRMQNPEMVLRLIVNHPYQVQFPLVPGTNELRVDEDVVLKSGKMMVLDAMLAKLKAGGHKVLIFSGFTMMLDLIADFLELRRHKYCRLDGSTKLEDRQTAIRRFNTKPNVFVFLISTRAGGLGINLTAADTVITYDSDWNPQADLQAQDRCHRIGQTRPVVVYRFTTKGTIDQVIIERAAAKRKLEKMIIRPGAYQITAKMSRSAGKVDLMELRSLLRADNFQGERHADGCVFNDDELDALLDRSDMIAAMSRPQEPPAVADGEQAPATSED